MSGRSREAPTKSPTSDGPVGPPEHGREAVPRAGCRDPLRCFTTTYGQTRPLVLARRLSSRFGLVSAPRIYHIAFRMGAWSPKPLDGLPLYAGDVPRPRPGSPSR